MSETVLTNARIVTADAVVDGSVSVRDGVIAAVDEGRSALPGAVDCEGDLIIPGLIELHTDNVERHVMPRPSAPWPVEAAVVAHDREVASVGITTVFDAISVGFVHSSDRRGEILVDVCNAITSRVEAGEFTADHHIHLRCELSQRALPGMFDALVDNRRVGLISVMDHTPGQRQFRDIRVYANYYQNKYSMSDAEFADFVAERIEDQKRYSATNRSHVVEAAQARGIAVASHDDATAEHVAEAVDNGMVIAEFPTTLEAARGSRNSDMSVLMGAPNLVRGSSHSGNVSARELAAEGLLDILSSDYVPSSLLYGAFTLERVVDGITLPDAVRTVTATPAQRVGLDDRGEIAVGKRADLVRVRDSGSVPLVRTVWRQGRVVA